MHRPHLFSRALTVLAAVAATGSMLAAAPGAGARTGDAAKPTAVLELGGRTLAFRAAPQDVVSFDLTFETGNAILLQPALQRLRQPDLGPFASAGGAVLHIVTVSGADQQLAFERARTVRAALVRVGMAEARGLAAAAVEAEGSGPATGSGRHEQVTITVLKVTRAACPACTSTTLGTAALDSGTVKMSTLSRTPVQTETPPIPAGGLADRREPVRNLTFTDRVPSADFQDGRDGVAPDPRPTASPGLAPTPPVRPADHTAERAGQRLHAPAPHAVATRDEDGLRRLRLADAAALGRAPQPGCRPRTLVIDDYSQPIQVWRCPR